MKTVRDIVYLAGGPARVAQSLGRKRNSVDYWIYRDRVPPNCVAKLSKMSGQPPHLIRPDVFPAPSRKGL